MTQPLFSSVRWAAAIVLLTAILATPLLTQNSHANPSGANVVAGNVNFDGMGTSNLTINQTTNTAIINWQNFSNGVGDTTRFVQPGINSLAVNRVVSGNPSSIFGTLSSNGSIVVINPNGILVGSGGLVDVRGALTLTTLDASNQDFLNGGAIRYFGNSGAGVDIQGSIYARDAVILGETVVHDGSINASRSVAIAAGNDIVLQQTANGATVSVRSNGVVNTANPYEAAINIRGTVRATGYERSGGRVMLRAGTNSGIINTGNIYAQQGTGAGGNVDIEAGRVDLANGSIDASGTNTQSGGSVNVVANDITSSGSSINVDGSTGGSINLDAANDVTISGDFTARGTAGEGGQIDIAGNSVNTESGTLVDVSGQTGGRIRTGGGFQGNDDDIRNSVVTNISEDSLFLADGNNGNAGTVIIWSDYDTTFAGEASAQAFGNVGNGGLVEVSGKDTLSYLGFVSTAAANGNYGTLLLDPTDVNIVNDITTTNEILDTTLANQLSATNVVIHTSSTRNEPGNITFEEGTQVRWSNLLGSSTTSLTVIAHNDINVLGTIRTDDAYIGPIFNPARQLIATGNGNINLVAGWTGLGLDPDDLLEIDSVFSNFQQADIGFLNPDDTPATPNLDGILTLPRNTGQGVVRVNSLTNTNHVEIGSEGGQVNIIAGEVIVTGTGLTGFDPVTGAPIGFDATIGISEVFQNFANSTGQINVLADGDISLIANAGSARIGNVSEVDSLDNFDGTFATNNDLHLFADGNFTSDIRVRAGNAGLGTLSLIAGSSDDALAQIGHRINQGGNINGEIDVFARNGIVITGGSGVDTSAQIGHYNPGTSASFIGDINVSTNGNIVARSGSGIASYTAIGNGHGLDADAFVVIQTDATGLFDDADGDGAFDFIDTDGDGINDFIDTDGDGFLDTFDLDGDGINDFIDIDGDGFHDPFGTTLQVQTGTGNSSSLGAINVSAGSNILLAAGSQTFAFSNIGGFGEQASLVGDITVNAANLTMTGGTQPAIEAFSSIGFTAGNTSNAFSNIEINVSSSVNALAGESGFLNFAQIGHGGLTNGFDGRYEGNVVINAPLLNAIGGGGRSNYVQIGHGAFTNLDEIIGAIALQGVELNLTGGSGSDGSARIGHGGSGSLESIIDGDINLIYTGPISLNGGTGEQRSFAQVGHGGGGFLNPFSELNNINGDLIISSGSTIDLNSGTTDNYTQIGHGGTNTDVPIQGVISVAAGSDLSLNGSGENAYASIGHGGLGSDGTKLGDIAVSAANISLNGGGGLNSHALIGINAVDGGPIGTENSIEVLQPDFTVADVPVDVNVTVTARGDLSLVAGLGGFSQIGHASLNTEDSVLSGLTRINASGDITLIGGTSDENYAKIGHGERDASSLASSSTVWAGDIFVSAGDNITVDNGLIGHTDGTIPLALAGGIAQNTTPRNTVHSLNVTTSGDTVIEASRNNPDTFGADFLGVSQGSLTTTADTSFSAAGELRIAVPNREENQIATGTLLNDVFYINPGNDEVSLDLDNALGDENLNFDGAFVFLALEFGQAAPVYAANLRNGGNYQLYYNSVNSLEFAARGRQTLDEIEPFDRFEDSQLYFNDQLAGLFTNPEEISFNDPQLYERELYRSSLRTAAITNSGRRFILYPREIEEDEEDEDEEDSE